ncbi:signal peptide peptidase-domain-containing protein [Vararia minispora EC-137]|uniref:Signal peptide peptidase-domain-containing protein n=1 Tax=Vararia minispora EC-137 TaxID=1314806 RepID=A0ACB8QYD1_9AGAM|nr:signal peptide peptidase-domain-containing protein [Vararia minispora EC-137]
MSSIQAFASYAGLIGIATTSVYAGAKGSVKVRRRPKKKGDAKHAEDDVPRLTSGDAWLFPVLGSAALLGLFLVIKYLGKEWINWLMGWYFSFAALYSVPSMLIKQTRWAIGRERWESCSLHSFDLVTPGSSRYSSALRTPSFVLIPLGILPTLYYQITSAKKPFLLTDLTALSFAHEAMSLLLLDSWSTGCVLLSGLFIYDIWWVFGTKVMVSVATSLDVPIKLLWPKSPLSLSKGFMMLGLGDIVVPGLFVATALRYDHARSGKVDTFPTPYFTACLVAYALGLVLTMTVMHAFNAAQPALLYLSPACILAFLGMAFYHGEFQEAWKWTDDDKSASEKSKIGAFLVGGSDQ